MKTNSFTVLAVGRAVLCVPQSAASVALGKSGAHGVTHPTWFALLCAAALFTHVTFAASGPKPPPPPQPSSGTLVLSYPNGSDWGLTVAPSGMIYAVGNNYPDDGYWKQLVLASGDSGNSWSLLDEFAPPGTFVDFWFGLGGGIASDSAGNLYVSGVIHDYAGAQPNQWYVRRSTDGGANWSTVDEFAMTAAAFGSNIDDIGITVDPAGDVYTAGLDFYSLDSNFHYDWIVRKGVGGTSFSTLDILPNSSPKDVFVHSTAGIFVVGQTKITNKSATSWAWLVRRSTNGGATWSNVDTFQLSSSKPSVAMGIGADAAGNLYVVGSGMSLNKGRNVFHWIVRKSTNGGNSWTTVDDYQLVAGNSSEARCIATDANGNLWVAGRGNAGQGNRWIVRKSVGGAGPWTTVDVFDAGVDANAIASSPSGNVFVGGAGGGNWLIKKY